MSLQVDGVWKADVWNPGAWFGGVWHEGPRGRARGRRRRYGARHEEIVARVNRADVDTVAKEYAQRIIEQAREIAGARTDLEAARRAATEGAARLRLIQALEARVIEAEEKMEQLKDDEDFIMILAFAV